MLKLWLERKNETHLHFLARICFCFLGLVRFIWVYSVFCSFSRCAQNTALANECIKQSCYQDGPMRLGSKNASWIDVFGASFGDLPFEASTHSRFLKPEHFMKRFKCGSWHLAGGQLAALELGSD